MIRASGNIEIIYEYGALRFTKNNEENAFNKDKATDMSWYLSEENKFKILSEEDEEIDIQGIEEVKDITYNGKDGVDYKTSINMALKINELIKAVKKLDKKIKEKEND